MMGPRQVEQASLFYEFSLERHVPAGHLLRSIKRFVDLSAQRRELAPFYSPTGRPSVDPELMLRMLLAGYCFGIGSERRLCDEVHLNLAYRWFCRLGLEGDVPDHSTSSKNRHGRFRDSDLLRRLFEMVLNRCITDRASTFDRGVYALKPRYTFEPARKMPRSVYEDAGRMAHGSMASDEDRASKRQRKKVEMLYAHPKRNFKLDRLRLRGPCGACDEFHLAAAAQNLRKMAKLIPMPDPSPRDAATAPPSLRQSNLSAASIHFAAEFSNGIGDLLSGRLGCRNKYLSAVQ